SSLNFPPCTFYSHARGIFSTAAWIDHVCKVTKLVHTFQRVTIQLDGAQLLSYCLRNQTVSALKTNCSLQSTPNPTTIFLNPLLAFCASHQVSSNTSHE